MKRKLLLAFVCCAAFAANAQEFPYSKYLNFTKQQFEENHFKYHKKSNAWTLNKTNGLNTTLNILAIIADAGEEVRPAENDYYITVQLGNEEKVWTVSYSSWWGVGNNLFILVFFS